MLNPPHARCSPLPSLLTAVVTALLWVKGVARDGQAFDYWLWFSDTYARTPAGWKYVFGQASLPLPR